MKRSNYAATVMALLVIFAARGLPQDLWPAEKRRKALNEKYDRKHLRKRRTFVVDRTKEFLVVPRNAQLAGEFDVAKTPPTVKLRVFPNLEPEYFSGVDRYMSCWANWACVCRSPDNRFYMAASDHLARGCHINLYEYRPDNNSFKRVLDVSRLLGWRADMYTHILRDFSGHKKPFEPA